MAPMAHSSKNSARPENPFAGRVRRIPASSGIKADTPQSSNACMGRQTSACAAMASSMVAHRLLRTAPMARPMFTRLRTVEELRIGHMIKNTITPPRI